MNLNKAIIVGRLTQEPEKRTIPNSGTNVVNFSMATNNFYKNSAGERQESTDFHNIVLFGNLADIASQYLKKGSLALIEGRIQTRSWDGKDGVKRYRTEIVGEKLQFGPRSEGEGNSPKKNNFANNNQDQDKEIPVINEDDEINVEDIPF